jgi:hypothetical protein
MEMVDPERVALLPGQSIEAMFLPESGVSGQVGFFIRSADRSVRSASGDGIQQRAGVIRFNDILLVVTMIRLGDRSEEFFDIWWNYHSPEAAEHFQRMATQDKLTLHFYTSEGKDFSLDQENAFRKFFSNLPGILKKAGQWTDIEFDRAVRGFCAESYPKDNLWDMIDLKPDAGLTELDLQSQINAYQENLPEELRPFYLYVPDKGHCIKVIPSVFEEQASEGNPQEFVHPAPVKTVLRCGIRWIKGFPVAPIPFIPGHGLAVPPDDSEF